MLEFNSPLGIHINREQTHFPNRLEVYKKPAIDYADGLVDYLCNKDMQIWDCASRILEIPLLPPQRLEDFRYSLENANVFSKQKGRNVFSTVQSSNGEIDIFLKWVNRGTKPVMARLADITFLFFHYHPSIDADLQFNQLMDEYLYFIEPGWTKKHTIEQVRNKDRLSQLAFSWQPKINFSNLEKYSTFYRFDPMNLPGATEDGGTYITS